jgi:precorrin-6B methylase 2
MDHLAQSSSTKVGKKLAPFNPASHEVVEMALDMLQIHDYDVLYDLGCGDARLLVQVMPSCSVAELFVLICILFRHV